MLKPFLVALVLAVQGLFALEASAAPQFGVGLSFEMGTGAAVVRMVQDASKFPVQPSQAAMAAQAAYPGSTVLGVKLLPSGEYAVTLKVGGSVQRVMVNATNGQVS